MVTCYITIYNCHCGRKKHWSRNRMKSAIFYLKINSHMQSIEDQSSFHSPLFLVWIKETSSISELKVVGVKKRKKGPNTVHWGLHDLSLLFWYKHRRGLIIYFFAAWRVKIFYIWMRRCWRFRLMFNSIYSLTKKIITHIGSLVASQQTEVPENRVFN